MLQSNLDLLVTAMEIQKRRTLLFESDIRQLAVEAAELKAMAMAVREEIRLNGTPGAVAIEVHPCPDRYAHKPHLWRDQRLDLAVWPTYRCDGRSTDAT